MPEAYLVLQLAIELAFAVLAIRTVAAWVRHPDGRHGNLALALGSLAIVVLIAPALGGEARPPAGHRRHARCLPGLRLQLLMFRDSFVPFGSMTRRLITAAIG